MTGMASGGRSPHVRARWLYFMVVIVGFFRHMVRAECPVAQCHSVRAVDLSARVQLNVLHLFILVRELF